eukprot:TRINITY_DN220_c0_g1_i5.p1 TRINITY_DN220_c0_g1~~TRINITY_DN220_c0_g1_i5.p1  ORF type:complete len:946 (+),score=204.35 TRINITY_DN220_c0_g1_i5:60-2897(+)
MTDTTDPRMSTGGEEEDKRCGKDISMETISGWVHSRMETFFGGVASKVVNYPFSTIGLTLIFTVGFLQGAWVYDEELSSDKQFAPQDSDAVTDGDWVVATFGNEARRGEVYFVSTENVLTTENLLFMNKYNTWVTTELYAMYGDQKVTWATQCDKQPTTGVCKGISSVLSLYDYNNTLINDQQIPVNSLTWRQKQPSGPDVTYYLSGVEYFPGTTNIRLATAARIVYNTRNEEREISGKGMIDPESQEFEIALSEQTRDLWDTPTSGMPSNLRIYPYTVGDADNEERNAIDGDVKSLIIGYILTIVYTCFVLHWKIKQPLLGLASVLSVGLSTGSSYGLCWLMGIKFNQVVQVLVLILLGIGVDDTFVIMDSWADESGIPNLKDRMVSALRHAGPAITVTSVTDLVAFLSGSSTSLPALRDFCFYAACGITFDFVYQCTFFVALAYLSSKRQETHRCCCCPVGGCCCCSGDNGDDAEVGGTKTLPPASEENGVLTRGLFTITRFLVGGLCGRLIVILISVFFITIGIWGSINVKMDFDNEWFVPSDADVQDTFDIRDEYFTRSDIPASVYFGRVEYHTLAVQLELNKSVELLQTNPWVVSGSINSWYVDFHGWVLENYPTEILNGGGVRDTSFYILLREFTGWDATRPGPAEFESHQNNIAWEGSNGTGVVKGASIDFLISGTASEEGDKATDCMGSLRDTIAPLSPAFVWSDPFVFWSSYEVMMDEVKQNVLVAAACVFVLVSLLVANITIGFIVVIIIGCVDVCMLGFMDHFGVAVNSVSVICIVVAIGLAVDYSVHIGHAYLTVTALNNSYGTSYQQRAAFAVAKMGPAVLNGAFSTFLAILPLSMAKSYVFSVFFRMFTIIIFFGVWFGVFVLPVLLSIWGPAPFSVATEIPLNKNPFASEYGDGESDVHDHPDHDTELGDVRKPVATIGGQHPGKHADNK